MIYAETDRLQLRQWRRDDLARYTELIGDYEVAKWLAVVPHPYTLRDAEDFFALQEAAYTIGQPELFVIATKTNDELMGAVGLHAPKHKNAAPHEKELGYWLGQPYWRQGLMREAVTAVLALVFAEPGIDVICATTDPDNYVSQSLLQGAWFEKLGRFPREGKGLRGGDEVIRWELRRSDYQNMQRNASLIPDEMPL